MCFTAVFHCPTRQLDLEVKALPSSTEAMIEMALEDNQLHVVTHDARDTHNITDKQIMF